MSASGYTMVDTLVALLVLSLAVTGLSGAMYVIARQQGAIGQRVSQTGALRTAETDLSNLLFYGRGPFRSTDAGTFNGASHHFQIDCEQDQPCAVDLLDMADGGLALQVQTQGTTRTISLKSVGPAHFRYDGSLGSAAVWPPAGADRQSLRSVALVRDGDPHAVLLAARLLGQAIVPASGRPVRTRQPQA